MTRFPFPQARASLVAPTLALSVLVACATPQKKLDEQSAAGLRSEASHEQSEAQQEKALYDANAKKVVPSTAHTPEVADVPDSTVNPTEVHLEKALRDEAHAKAHEAAAAQLVAFEAKECQSLSNSERSACPMLGPIVKVTDIPGGARLAYKSGTDMMPILARMRCHLAYARTRGYGVASGCPIYVRGVDIVASKDGSGIDVTTRDKADAEGLRQSSRSMAGL